jgi:hypothetical protein
VKDDPQTSIYYITHVVFSVKDDPQTSIYITHVVFSVKDDPRLNRIPVQYDPRNFSFRIKNRDSVVVEHRQGLLTTKPNKSSS